MRVRMYIFIQIRNAYRSAYNAVMHYNVPVCSIRVQQIISCTGTAVFLCVRLCRRGDNALEEIDHLVEQLSDLAAGFYYFAVNVYAIG